MSSISPGLAGARDTVPMLVGAAPFGLIFGALATSSHLTPAQTLAMSLLVFAGSSQFIAVGLFAAGTALPVLWLTTLVVNLRHALYSATLLPYARDWPLRWRLPLAFWLTDETFAVVEHRLRSGMVAGGAAYWLGSSLAMYGNWLLWTLLGIMVGQGIPGIAGWGLDFAMLATFTAIVAPQLKTRPALAAALVAGAVALWLRALPYQGGLMLASCAGIATGMLLDGKRKEAA
ncbi:AzlC family ABC transporter permease [Crenobacter caeni]|uniref:AzlC family ABC transporter permease n=1 Tax=Crenobacter caeni TaxID=2705474 RepID=A0A6B2KMA5_9NEIS|nr:AzlC family ABC transporter permease [Crenobacter caeni]NDV11290.1 AzlC family ABC transporter permease [Crenobacter caeni]